MTKHVKNNNHIYILFLLMTGVILFSVFVLSQQSLRLDEAQSLWQTSHSPERMLELIAEDVHVPLYHLMLHYWQMFWGNGVFAARMLSLIFFTFTIPAVYFLGKVTYGKKIGLFAATLTAISPFMNWFGSEIRMYSLLTLVAIVNQYMFVRIYKHRVNAFAGIPQNKWDGDKKENRILHWIGYGITTIMGIFTHYFFFFVLFAQAIFVLAYRKGFSISTIKGFIITGGVVVLSFAPWGLKVIQEDAIGFARPVIAEPQIIDVFNSFSQFIFGFHPDGINAIILSFWPIAALFAFLALSKKTFVSHDAFYLLIAAIIPVVTVFVLSLLITPFYLSRFFIFIVPSLYILLGWVISTYGRGITKFMSFLIIGVMASSLIYQTTSSETPVKENYAGANEFLEEHATAQDVILIAPPFTIYPFEYYYTGAAAVKTVPQWDRLEIGPIPEFPHDNIDEEMRALTQNYQNAWILVNYLKQGYEEDLTTHFEMNYEQIARIELSPGMELYGYRIRYDNLRAGVDNL